MKRKLDTDTLVELIDSTDAVSDLEDGYHNLSSTELAQLADFAEQAFGERAAEMVEPLAVVDDLLELATAGADEKDLDMSQLVTFKIAKGSCQRVLGPRLALNEDGEPIFVFGSVRVPVVQQGVKIKIGDLVAENLATEYSVQAKALANNETMYIHTMDLTSADGDVFPVELYVKREIDADAVKPLLKTGEPLSDVLAQYGKGGGGAVSLANYISAEQVPWSASIKTIHVWDTESKFSQDGKAYAATLEDGTTVWLRGKAEAWVRRNSTAAKKILEDGGEVVLKVTDMRTAENGRTSMTTRIVLPSSNSIVPSLGSSSTKAAKAALKPAEEAKPKAAVKAAAKVEPVAEAEPVVEVEPVEVEPVAEAGEAPKAAVRRASPFAAAKRRQTAAA